MVEKYSDIEERKDDSKEIEELKRKVVTTRRWQELEPRRVRAVEACVGRYETELSFEPGAIMALPLSQRFGRPAGGWRANSTTPAGWRAPWREGWALCRRVV